MDLLKRISISAIIFFLGIFYVWGQPESTLSPGNPFITNYTDARYLQTGKNWGISQGTDGIMYFANNYGLVLFNGYEWEIIGQPNNQSELRSFYVEKKKIFIGGTSEIGYFEQNPSGKFSYVELTHLIKDSTFSFNDVREIASFKDRVFFLTDNGILMYLDEEIHILGKGIPFRGWAYGIDELVFGANGIRLFRYEEDSLIELTDSEKLANAQISFLIIIRPGDYLIGTNTKGIFEYRGGEINVWNPNNQSYFIKNHVRKALILNKDQLILGSLHNGIILTNYQGDIFNVINDNNGLPDHNIRSIYKDNQGNIWTAVDGGVSYLELNSPFSILNKKNGLRGEVACILKHNQYLYVGTSRGLYLSEWQQNQLHNINFSLIPNTTGQCWQLYEHEEQILLAHHNGVYTINKDEANYIGGKGNWNFAEVPGKPQLVLSGNYSGISLLEKKNNKYKVSRQLTGFEETARELLFDDDHNIWVSHGYSGIYKMKLSADARSLEDIKLYDDKKGLPSNLYNNLILIDKGLLFGTQNGVYQYNVELDQMEVNPLFAEILGEETLVRKLYQTPEGNYLSIKNYDRSDEIELVELLEDGSYTLSSMPFQKLRGQFIPAFESINFPNNAQILFGGKYGLIVYNTQYDEVSGKSHQCYITEVKLPLIDSVVFTSNSLINPNDHMLLEIGESEPISISFATSFFEAIPYMNYSTYMEGYDENWQEWTDESERSFYQLPEGNYTFWVKSRNIYDEIGQSASFSFQLKRNTSFWSSLNSVWLLIFLGIFGLAYYVFRLQKSRTAEKIASLEAELRQKKEKIEQYKSKKAGWKQEKELFNQKLSRANLQNEIHAGLIQNIENLSERDAGSKEYQKAIQEFQKNLKEVQLQLEAHNLIVSDDFLTKIKSSYPDLSARELRLCSYLKLNVSSKEIAEYLCISIRGVESLRYRVRKKLGLRTGEDLTDFILSL